MASEKVTCTGASIGGLLIGVGVVWGVRSILYSRDYSKWKSSGIPEDWQPASRTQPKDRDFFFCLPVWTVVAAMFLG